MIDTEFNASQIVREWDLNAEARHAQIVSKIDVSYHKILIPTLLQLMGNIKHLNVLDVGCGSGIFASEMSKSGARVIGIDPSSEMIRIANTEYGKIENVKFYCNSIHEFAKFTDKNFDVVISNMSLITIQNLDDTIKSISTLLKQKGKFVFNITHPCFWNQYRKYEPNELFEYKKEHPQKGKFVISNDQNALPSPTTHFHRPLERYFQSLKNAGFTIEDIIEPYPNEEDMKRYSKPWEVPRFLSIKSLKL